MYYSRISLRTVVFLQLSVLLYVVAIVNINSCNKSESITMLQYSINALPGGVLKKKLDIFLLSILSTHPAID